MSNGNALEQIPTVELAPTEQEPRSLMAVIARAVMAGTTPVETMQALLDMQFKIETRQAEVEFNAALARLMLRLPRVEKGGVIFNRDGTTIRSRYAYYEDIDAAIRPLLAEEGFSISFDTDDSTPKHIRVTGTLSHRLGHNRTSQITLPTDNPVITGSQAVVSAVSFGKRTIVVNMLNIVTVGADNDGQGEPQFITEDHVLQLETLLADTGADLQRFLVWAGVSKLSEILDKNFETMLQGLRAKARRTTGNETADPGKIEVKTPGAQWRRS
jgi:hypothetical protein